MTPTPRRPAGHPWLDLRDAVTGLVVEGLEDAGAAAALDAAGAFAAAGPGEGSAPPVGEAAERLKRAGILDRSGRLAPEAVRRRRYLAERARRAAVARAGLARPAPPDLEGLPPELYRAAWLVRAGLYFEAHDLLEGQWRRASGETRELYQGVIQMAVALEHAVTGNRAGSVSLLEAARARLAPLGGAGAGLDLEALRTGLARAAAALGAGAPFDPALVPPLVAAGRR
ncbi:MAG TPA: DUF309 domain-containing protein [Thermodesulfobacteriota bacterium]